MGKFYVQSGTVRSVVQADSQRRAAMWAVHQVMQQVLPSEDQPVSVADVSDQSGTNEKEVTVLSARITVSERGFDRDDSTVMPTLDVVTEWNQMVATLDRLERMLYVS